LSIFIAQKIIYKHAFMNRALIIKLAGFVLLVMGILTLSN
jgi:hypothetical protein